MSTVPAVNNRHKILAYLVETINWGPKKTLPRVAKEFKITEGLAKRYAVAFMRALLFQYHGGLTVLKDARVSAFNGLDLLDQDNTDELFELMENNSATIRNMNNNRNTNHNKLLAVDMFHPDTRVNKEAIEIAKAKRASKSLVSPLPEQEVITEPEVEHEVEVDFTIGEEDLHEGNAMKRQISDLMADAAQYGDMANVRIAVWADQIEFSVTYSPKETQKK